MTHTTEVYVQHRAGRSGHGYYRAKCSCGWRTPRLTQKQAARAAFEHEQTESTNPKEAT